MRKRICILILSLVVYLPTSASLLEDRGFQNGKCYEHLVQITRYQEKCFLNLAAQTRAQMTVEMANCPKEKGEWQYSHFRMQIDSEKAPVAQWLKGFEVHDQMIEILGLQEDGLAHPKACK